MDSTKIKNFIIIVLVLVNVFLLALVLIDRGEARSAEKSVRDNIIKILSDNGIELSDRIKISEGNSQLLNIHRDLAKEKKIASSVLGKVYMSDLGGNIYYYKGSSGEAQFLSTGTFEMRIENGAILIGSDPVRTSERVLRKMGMVADKESAKVEYTDNGEAVTVTLDVAWNGDTVYNCNVSFLFVSDNLTLVMGRRPFDKVDSDTSDGMLSIATVMMRFLDIMNTGGYVCSEIQNIENGYIMNVSAPGNSTLNPVWKVMTDTGDYYINGITGQEVILAN